MTPETKLKNAVKKYLKEIGAFHVKLSENWISGVPDILVAYKGRMLLLELKAEKGVVSKLQEWTIIQIKAQGCEAYVARSLDEVKEIMEWLPS